MAGRPGVRKGGPLGEQVALAELRVDDPLEDGDQDDYKERVEGLHLVRINLYTEYTKYSPIHTVIYFIYSHKRRVIE